MKRKLVLTAWVFQITLERMTMLPLSAISTGLEHVCINVIYSFVVVHTQAERIMYRLLNTIYSHITDSKPTLFYIRTTPFQTALKSSPHSFLYS